MASRWVATLFYTRVGHCLVTVRKEGIGILLDERATNAWRAAGEAWEAISSRIITARLKITRAGQRITCLAMLELVKCRLKLLNCWWVIKVQPDLVVVADYPLQSRKIHYRDVQNI